MLLLLIHLGGEPSFHLVMGHPSERLHCLLRSRGLVFHTGKTVYDSVQFNSESTNGFCAIQSCYNVVL